jgi:hypothetical protein
MLEADRVTGIPSTCALEALPVPVAVVDREGHYVFLNRACAEDPGLARGLPGGPARGAGLQRLDVRRYAPYERVLKTGKPVYFQETDDDGQPTLWLYSPVPGSDGEVAEVLIIGMDAGTVQQQAAAAFRQTLAEHVNRELQVPLTVLVGLANALAQELSGLQGERASQIALNGQLLLRQLRTLHLSLSLGQAR